MGRPHDASPPDAAPDAALDVPLDAGPFGAWLDALVAGGEADVPCGPCTACCRSSQFVHVAPDERAALAVVPAALRFPAPGLPRGHVVLPFDDRGRCPMLADAGCTIYDARPRTCRAYDCRVFAAAGVEPERPAKAAIADQARRWRFTHPTPDDEVRHDAVRAAARRLGTVAGAPTAATQRAHLACLVSPAFLAGEPGGLRLVEPTPDEVAAALRRATAVAG